MRLLTVLVLAFSLSLQLMSQEYQVKLLRQASPGDKCREISAGTSSQQTTVISGTQTIKSANVQTAVELDAEITVLEVDKEGHSIKESVLVNSCSLKIGDEKSAPFEKGTIITVSVKDNKMVFDIDGKPVDEKIAAALTLVESVYTGGASDDEVFGTNEKKKIGDSWKINTENIPEDMARHDIKVDRKNIDGSARIEKIEKSGDLECLLIAAEMSIKDIVPKLPEGLKVESSAMLNTFTALFPVDVSVPRLDQTIEFKMQMTMTGRPNPEAPEVRIISTNERKTVQKVILGKK